MFVRLMRSAWIVCCVLVIWGCQTAPPYTGFESEEELEAYVTETQMLHRHALVEVKGGGVFPFDTDMNPGAGFGVKGSLEAYKNLYFGFEYDFFRQQIDESLEDFLGVFKSNPVKGEALAKSADAEQWLDEFDRHNLLFTADYYVPLGEAWGVYTPIFRVGLGLGAVLIDGNEVSAGTLASDVNARLFASFMARPSLGISFPLHENVRLFAEANVDLVPDGDLTIDGKLVGRRARIQDKVNFSAVSVMGGVLFTW